MYRHQIGTDAVYYTDMVILPFSVLTTLADVSNRLPANVSTGLNLFFSNWLRLTIHCTVGFLCMADGHWNTFFYHYHYHYNLQHYREVMTAIEQVSIGSNSAIDCHSSLVTDLQFEFAVFTLTFFIHVNLTFTKWWSKNLLLLQFKTLNNLKFSTQLNVYLPENIHTTVQHQMAGNEVRVSEAALAVHM